MSIASQLTALLQDITNARTAIINKGGIVTSGGGSSQLSTDIGTILCSYVFITSNKKLATISCGLYSYTLTGDEKSHAFPVAAGTYVCKLTLGTQTSSSVSVTVTTNNVYAVALTVGRIPSTYQEVQYIRSDGNQYINTQVAPFNGIYAESKMYFNVTQFARGYFGVGGDDSWGIYEGSYNIWDNYNDDVNTNLPANILGYMNITKNGRVTTLSYSVDGVNWTTSTTTHTTTYPTDSRPITIFAKNGSSRQWGRYDLFSFKIGNSASNLIRDFIPCYKISDGTIGLYDAVSGTFFTNQGTGNFTKGPNVD